MTNESKELVQKILALSADDRAELLQELLVSLEPAMDPEVAAAWEEELDRREAAIDSGAVEMLDWDEVYQRLRNKKRATG